MNDIPDNCKKWMTTQCRTCLDILKSVSESVATGVPADRALSAIFRKNRNFGSRDRQFYYPAVFAWFRWLGWLKYAGLSMNEYGILAAFAAEGSELPRAAELWVSLLPEEQRKKWNEALTMPNPEDRFRTFTGISVSDERLIPEWALPLLADGGKEYYLPFLKRRSPLWIRIVPGKESQVLSEFQNKGIEYQQHPFVFNAYRFDNRHIRFYTALSWKQGLFEMQDFSSQCIGIAAGVQSGENWFDACAGGGGKTLLLASMVGPRGHVSVYDIRDSKLDELEERCARTPYKKIINREHSFSPGRLFDGVLIDAPCSSSGRWRRDPDAPWRIEGKNQIDEIAALQYDLLCQAADSVRPGGKLVYGTCSVFEKENAGQIRRFLEEHPGSFEPVPFQSPHDGSLRTDGMLQSFPADSDCDGSFVAVLRKKQ